MRQAYLQKGGNDPNVLAQFASMQAEAMALEVKQQKPPKAKRKSESSPKAMVYIQGCF